MVTFHLRHEMKWHAPIRAKHSNFEISRFFKVARSFVYKVRKELADPSGDVCPVVFGQCQDTTIREFEYYRCESRIIHYQMMSSCSRAQSAVHEVIWCKWYFMKKGKVRTTVVPIKTTTEWFEITNKTGNALGLFFFRGKSNSSKIKKK